MTNVWTSSGRLQLEKMDAAEVKQKRALTESNTYSFEKKKKKNVNYISTGLRTKKIFV